MNRKLNKIMIYKIKIKPIISLGIIVIGTILGILIFRGVQKKAKRKIEAFENTILIRDSSRFIDLKNGVFIAEGRLKALYPQTTPDLPGRYFKIELVLEQYNRHTRVHMVSDGNGGTRPRTETYHSWDAIKSETLVSDSTIFLGRHIKTAEIDYNHYPRYIETKYDSGKKFRTVYRVCPEETKIGLLYGECENGTLMHLKFKEEKTIQGERERLDKKYRNNPGMILSMWVCFCIFLIIGVWFYENIFEL